VSYVREILRPNEKIRARGRIHWIIYVPGIAFLIVAGIAAAMNQTSAASDWICAIIGLLLLLKAWIRQWTTEIAVTNARVIYKTGLIRRDTAEMNMNKVESVVVNQSILGRLLDYGTITIRGTGSSIENLKQIRSPIALRNTITAGQHHEQPAPVT
jgi:uncharacterized membrane protein YdbT with pleckstrin-like domain